MWLLTALCSLVKRTWLGDFFGKIEMAIHYTGQRFVAGESNLLGCDPILNRKFVK